MFKPHKSKCKGSFQESEVLKYLVKTRWPDNKHNESQEVIIETKNLLKDVHSVRGLSYSVLDETTFQDRFG